MIFLPEELEEQLEVVVKKIVDYSVSMGLIFMIVFWNIF